MIELRHEPGASRGISAPIIRCDFCKDDIEDANMANMVWRYELPLLQFHLHKSCNRAFEKQYATSLNEEYLLFAWMPLEVFLDFLCNNVGMRRSALPYPLTEQAKRRRNATKGKP